MRVSYEWVTEEVDADGVDPEILDTYASGTYAEALRRGLESDGPFRVALRRDRGDDVEGLVERHYAYVVDGVLNPCMETCDGAEDGPPVPRRFFREVRPCGR